MAMTSEHNVWEKCAQSGINGVLKKPLVLQEVKAELTRIIQNT
jgi:ethylene receptor